MNNYNVVELFSGIGSQAKALKNIGMNVTTVGTCEWDVHALVAYDAIHNSPELPFEVLKLKKEDILEKLKDYTLSNNGKEPMEYSMLKTYSVDALRRIYAAIIRCKNFVDVSNLKGNDLADDIDIMTYSFPCQDLSNVGALHGYTKGIDRDSGSRSSLLWQVGRILKEMRESQKPLPRFLLMENVPNLLSKRHFPNFKLWMKELEELGYINKYYLLNASDFGLPQNRPRLLMLSVHVGCDQEMINLVSGYFESKAKSDDIITDYMLSQYYKAYSVQDFYRIDYSNQVFFDEAVACTPNDTPSRRDIWKDNPQLVLEGNIINPNYSVVRTITTKQDRHPNSGNLYFDSSIEGKSKFRYLTPRECFLFMGFTDTDYENVVKNNPEIHVRNRLFARDKVIRMAGNSIPVKLLEGIFLQIKQIDSILSDYGRTQ